jgi:hypothetical protein
MKGSINSSNTAKFHSSISKSSSPQQLLNAIKSDPEESAKASKNLYETIPIAYQKQHINSVNKYFEDHSLPWRAFWDSELRRIYYVSNFLGTTRRAQYNPPSGPPAPVSQPSSPTSPCPTILWEEDDDNVMFITLRQTFENPMTTKIRRDETFQKAIEDYAKLYKKEHVYLTLYHHAANRCIHENTPYTPEMLEFEAVHTYLQVMVGWEKI